MTHQTRDDMIIFIHQQLVATINTLCYSYSLWRCVCLSVCMFVCSLQADVLRCKFIQFLQRQLDICWMQCCITLSELSVFPSLA